MSTVIDTTAQRNAYNNRQELTRSGGQLVAWDWLSASLTTAIGLTTTCVVSYFE